MKSRAFIDTATLYAQAGNGGNGCVSFRREKFIPKGGPDGGDGARGGHVILVADKNVSSLIGIFYAPHQRAEHGGPGKGKQLHGRNGKDNYVKIPCGTEIVDAETGETLADIVDDGEELLLASGGKGGRGNCHWKTSTHQAPHEHTDGTEGQQRTVRLQLKIVADVGLVGFPNAGKSSILGKISDAHPKVGAYPFTTLNPIIGTLEFEDYSKLTVADIPGLIEGAHDGVGLGHAFLRHIERAAALVYVLDMAGVDGRTPHDDYENLREELEYHDPELMNKPSVVVANKMDLPEAESNRDEFFKKTGIETIAVSAVTGDGLTDLRNAIHSIGLATGKGHVGFRERGA